MAIPILPLNRARALPVGPRESLLLHPMCERKRLRIIDEVFWHFRSQAEFRLECAVAKGEQDCRNRRDYQSVSFLSIGHFVCLIESFTRLTSSTRLNRRCPSSGSLQQDRDVIAVTDRPFGIVLQYIGESLTLWEQYVANLVLI